jgi:hypothetical protein
MCPAAMDFTLTISSGNAEWCPMELFRLVCSSSSKLFSNKEGIRGSELVVAASTWATKSSFLLRALLGRV